MFIRWKKLLEHRWMDLTDSADVLSEVFGFGNMEYFAGMKLFNKVIDRLGVGMDQQRRYEVFDRIYEEGMREKKLERGRNSR